MRVAMKKNGAVAPKLTELYKLEQDYSTWLSQAKGMRDHITHVAGIPLAFYVGGAKDGTISFRHPKTLVDMPGHYFDTIEQWLLEMEALIRRMRT